MPDNSTAGYNVFEYDSSIAVITLNQNVLGGNEAWTFTATLHELSQNNVKHIIIDLANVEIINSSGLGMLVSGLSTLGKQNILMSLVSVPQKVNSLLSMTHLDKVFKIFEDVNDAVQNNK